MQLKLTGKSADYLGIEGKLKYEARLKALAEGGSMSALRGHQTENRKCRRRYLVFCSGHQFCELQGCKRRSKRPGYFLSGQLKTVPYASVKADAIRDYQPYSTGFPSLYPKLLPLICLPMNA
jgi:alpha-L-fucosidase 2